MGTIVDVEPGTVSRERNVSQKSFKSTKKWISQEFYQALNRHMVNEQGLNITYAQQMVQSVVDMATNPEKDDYVRLAATKFITEHLEGKAGTMQEEKNEELPKIVICVQGTSTEEIRRVAEETEGSEPEEDILVEISDEDGTNSEEYIV